jgi:hypothetical protein
MKKIQTKNTILVLPFVLSFFLTGCQKLFDYIHKPGNGDVVSNICQVQTIKSDGLYGANYVFNYNKRGDLESIITDVLVDGNPNVFFTYDNKHRASQVLSSFTATPTTPGNVWSLEKFFYNSSNQIVKDSVYKFLAIGEDGVIISSYLSLSIAVFQYDAFNRIIACSDSVWFYGIFTNTDHYIYKYDENGNLAYTARQYQGTTPLIYKDTFRIMPYDNKISIRRTNKMWMFLDRNYSVNNSLSGATSYNSFGLPVFFDSRKYLQGLNYLTTVLRGNVTVEYKCDGAEN